MPAASLIKSYRSLITVRFVALKATAFHKLAHLCKVNDSRTHSQTHTDTYTVAHSHRQRLAEVVEAEEKQLTCFAR